MTPDGIFYFLNSFIEWSECEKNVAKRKKEKIEKEKIKSCEVIVY